MVKFLWPCARLHLSSRFLLWDNVKTYTSVESLKIRRRPCFAKHTVHLNHYYLLKLCTSSERSDLMLFCSFFYWLYILFILLFTASHFSPRFLGFCHLPEGLLKCLKCHIAILSSISPLTRINPRLHTRALGSYHWPLRP